MKQLGSVSKEERPEIGKTLNLAKQKIQQFLQIQEQKIKNVTYQNSLQKDMISIRMKFVPGIMKICLPRVPLPFLKLISTNFIKKQIYQKSRIPSMFLPEFR